MSSPCKLDDAAAKLRDRSNPVVAAFKANDHDQIRQVGWWPIWEALQTWWTRPNPPATAASMVAYATRAGAFNPDVILDALETFDGKFRPSASDLLAAVRELAGEAASPQRCGEGKGGGPVRRIAHLAARTRAPEAHAAAAAAHSDGAPACSCGFRRPTWKVDSAGVARCPACNGLDHNQLYTAEDAGLILEAVA